jgi:hypothetical protein
MENTKAMSPKSIVEDFRNVVVTHSTDFQTEDWLRASLKSILYWVAENLPNDEAMKRNHEYSDAIEDCRAVILSEANKLT